MQCKECGAENQDGKFCEKCGADLENIAEETPCEETPCEQEIPVQADDQPDNTAQAEEQERLPEKSAEVRSALYNMDMYNTGTITHPSEKPVKKRKFYCPKNPVLWSFLWLLVFAAVLAALTVVFFNVKLGGLEIVFGIIFAVFTAAVLALDFGFYLPDALRLKRMFKGKGVRFSYTLNDDEVKDLAQKARKKNRLLYLIAAIIGLLFSAYYIYILADAIVKTNLMWISLAFSLGVFVIFTALFFIMPKINYERMLQGGEQVIIGERSVYYGGNYYHWRKIQPDATIANISSRKNELELTFTQEFSNGSTKRRKLELHLPDRELKNARKLVKECEKNYKAYQEKQAKMSVLNEAQDEDKKEKD